MRARPMQGRVCVRAVRRRAQDPGPLARVGGVCALLCGTALGVICAGVLWVRRVVLFKRVAVDPCLCHKCASFVVMEASAIVSHAHMYVPGVPA